MLGHFAVKADKVVPLIALLANVIPLDDGVRVAQFAARNDPGEARRLPGQINPPCQPADDSARLRHLRHDPIMQSPMPWSLQHVSRKLWFARLRRRFRLRFFLDHLRINRILSNGRDFTRHEFKRDRVGNPRWNLQRYYVGHVTVLVQPISDSSGHG